MAKDSFVLYTRYRNDTAALTDNEMGRLFRAILDYVATRELPDSNYLDPAAAMAFSFIRTQLDVDIAKYEETCRMRGEIGRKGGLAKAAKAKQELAKGSKGKQGLANLPDSEYESDCEYEHDCEDEGEYEGEGVIDVLAHGLALPPSFIPKLHEWFEHKQKRNGKQTESAINAALKLIAKNVGKHGQDAVSDLIDTMIMENRGSIYFDRLERRDTGERDSGRNPGNRETQRIGNYIE